MSDVRRYNPWTHCPEIEAVLASDYDALRLQLTNRTAEVVAVQGRLAAADGLLREVRNRLVGPTDYDSRSWAEIRVAIDAHLAGAAPASCQHDKVYAGRLLADQPTVVVEP